MRKHSVRKWLHAILDLLPVILIPVFMIYSHRHTIENSSISIEKSIDYRFNQLIVNGNFSDGDSDWVYDFSTVDEVYYNSNAYLDNYIALTDFDLTQNYSWETPFALNDKVLINFYGWGETDVFNFNVRLGQVSSNIYFDYRCDLQLASGNLVQFIIDYPLEHDVDIDYYINFYSQFNGLCSVGNIELFNLTFMFGSGNEPTVEEFNNYFALPYYDYGISDTYETLNFSTLYNDTDIMSQVIYVMYNAIDKYFNMDKTFNLGAIHNWVNANLFSSEPPLIANIVWHIISYEFIMDLVFLVYAVFMFVIDFADRCLNSFFDKSFGGGR